MNTSTRLWNPTLGEDAIVASATITKDEPASPLDVAKNRKARLAATLLAEQAKRAPRLAYTSESK